MTCCSSRSLYSFTAAASADEITDMAVESIDGPTEFAFDLIRSVSLPFARDEFYLFLVS
jgi:hypothetical protein